MTKEELKQEAEEWLRGKGDNYGHFPIDCVRAYLASAEPREKQIQKKDKKIAELEKENAELKKLKRECETSLCRAEYQYNYEQLTKAKDLLKRCYENYIYLEPLRSEIEQFLNSEVEK